ncbi:hypothetical protein V6N13_054868 [Hibiscus sabdariffa]
MKSLELFSKSCSFNKYWQRTKNVSATGIQPDYCVAATAGNKEEDQSKETCTLFKFIPVGCHQNPTGLLGRQSAGSTTMADAMICSE